MQFIYNTFIILEIIYLGHLLCFEKGDNTMTLRHLTIFIEVYKTCNMTTAAKNLYMTQPSVSHAIKELERFYDIKLFERLSQKLYVTEGGQNLFNYATRILALHEECIVNLKSNEGMEKLKIGGNYTVGIHMLGTITDLFSHQHPSIKLFVTINKSSYIKTLLRKNDLDLALVEESYAMSDSDMIQRPFYHDRIVAVVSPTHHLALQTNLFLEDIALEPFLTREKGVGAREMFEHIMVTNGYAFEPYWESISATSLINECKRKTGIGILPYEAVKEQLKTGELVELTIQDINLCRNLVIMYHKSKSLSTNLKRFIDVCMSSVE